MSRSIQTKEACPPVITAASPVTFDPNVHSSRPRSRRSKGAANKSYIGHSTSDGTSGSMALAEVCSCQSEWQTKEEQIKVLQEKAAEAQ
jgi:hypothetical protein